VTTPNEPDFGGRIGRTYQDSTPWWPDPPAGLGGPNVVMIVLDDTGFAHFGCYGSELATPSIDRLAANGLRYTGFHTTALCSPSRAALLTGRNPHAVGMRGVSNWNTGFPHMRGGISPRAATVAELLRSHGYATYAAGKWHLAPMEECSAAGPHTNWPLQKGFDRFYGFLQGETDQFHPELTSDNGHIDPPGRPEDGYHVSEDIVDQASLWIGDLQSIRPDRPFHRSR
jgi:arylsulfatase